MDFSLTTLFVVPKAQTALPPAGVVSTQDLGAGAVGLFINDYSVATAGNIVTAPYFYIAQGRTNTYLQGSIRSDKIRGCVGTTPGGCNTNVTEFYKVNGCANSTTQITEIGSWTVQCGDVLTVTIRAHSSYLDTLYFNGFTRSVTVQAPCCDCTGDPCVNVPISALIDKIIVKLREHAPGNNPDNISLDQFFIFENIGGTILRITGKPLTKYAQPCDVAAFPHEYDRMWFRTFVYEGPATTADFIVADACNLVANPVITQRASYPTGTAAEIKQLEKNFYSYQAGYLKHLYRMMGYNENYDSLVDDAATYNTYYIKYNEYDRSAYQWGDYVPEDQMSIIAVDVTNAAVTTALETLLVAGLGATIATGLNAVCPPTTTSTSTTAGPTTTTTSTLIP